MKIRSITMWFICCIFMFSPGAPDAKYKSAFINILTIEKRQNKVITIGGRIAKEPKTPSSSNNEERSPDTVWRDKKTAAECLSHLYLSKELSDIDIIFVNDTNITIRAHRFVLSMRSAFFADKLSNSEGPITVLIKDVKPEIMEVVLRYIYTDNAELTRNNIYSCLHAAKVYHLVGLVQRCLDFLVKTIDANSVCMCYNYAISYDTEPLKKICLSFIMENAPNVLFTPGFLKLPRATLVNVLKQNDLAAGELDVFKAARKWAEQKCETKKIPKTGENMRDQLKEEALIEIRFARIPNNDLVNVVAPSGILTEKELMNLYEYHVTKRSADLEKKFRKPERRGAPITIDLRQYDMFEFDHCKHQNSYALEIECELYDVSYDQSELGESRVENIRNKESLKLKSISGTFVETVRRIIVSNTCVNDYEVFGNSITFQTPIQMCNGEIIQFIPENLEQPASVINLNGLNLKPFNINQNGDVFTLVQFPARTETITFLK